MGQADPHAPGSRAAITDRQVEATADVIFGPRWRYWCRQFALTGDAAIERRLKTAREALEAAANV